MEPRQRSKIQFFVSEDVATEFWHWHKTVFFLFNLRVENLFIMQGTWENIRLARCSAAYVHAGVFTD